jgi:hypothetical protein
VAAIFFLSAPLQACSPDDGGDGKKAKAEVCSIEPTLAVSSCALSTSNFSAPTTITNTFFPLEPGRVLTLAGEEEGAAIDLMIEVSSSTEMFGDVAARVVNETANEDGELVEFAVNYFAQSDRGDVCYFGEVVDNYVDGKIDNHDGSWRADEGDHQPGIIMPASPAVGDAYRQEVAEGIAEDLAEVTALGAQLVTPYGTLTDTMTTGECSPLEANSYESKVYARGIGGAFDNGLKLTSVLIP